MPLSLPLASIQVPVPVQGQCLFWVSTLLHWLQLSACSDIVVEGCVSLLQAAGDPLGVEEL